MAKRSNNIRYCATDSKRKAILLGIVLFLIGICCILAGSYAYYQTAVSGTTNATIASWSFKVNNSTSSFNVALVPSDSTKTANSTIAPGTSGSFTLTLDASASDMAVDYVLTFSNFSNVPANMQFYLDSAYNSPVNIAATGYSVSGTISARSTKTITYYWRWQAGTSSSVSTDNLSINKSVSFRASVVGTQKQ